MITTSSQAEKKPWGTLILSSVAGLIFIIINFPKLLKQMLMAMNAPEQLVTFIVATQTWLDETALNLSGTSLDDTFELMMSYSFIGLWFYLISLLIFTLRHREVRLLAFGLAGLGLGFLALHLMVWVSLFLWWLMWFMLLIAVYLRWFILLLVSLITPHLWWILLCLMGLVGVTMLVNLRRQLLKIIAGALVAVGLGWLAYRFLPILWAWLVAFIRPIIEFLAYLWLTYITPILEFISYIMSKIILLLIPIITFLIIALMTMLIALAILTTCGHFVLDQFRAAWYAGQGRKGVLLGAFSIGSALALIFLATVANPTLAQRIDDGWQRSWHTMDEMAGTDIDSQSFAQIELSDNFVDTLPATAQSFVNVNMVTHSAPIYDAGILLLVLMLSYIGLARHLRPTLADMETELPVTFYPKEYFAIFGGLIFAIFVIMLTAMAEGGE